MFTNFILALPWNYKKTSRLYSVCSILVFIHFETDVGVDESRVPVLILIQDTGYDLLVPAGILFIWTRLLYCTQDTVYDLHYLYTGLWIRSILLNCTVPNNITLYTVKCIHISWRCRFNCSVLYNVNTVLHSVLWKLIGKIIFWNWIWGKIFTVDPKSRFAENSNGSKNCSD